MVLIAANTRRIRLGTGVVQLSARTPAATAMHAVTIDHISGGRTILGLGVSGPQVVEGWYGMPSKMPLARTREYVEILRRTFRREGPLEFQGDHFQLPFTGEGSVGLGRPLRIMTHPVREIPIWIGAEGPKNVAQTVEIADGWLPLYFTPFRSDVYGEQLEHVKPGFEIAVNVAMRVHDDVEEAYRIQDIFMDGKREEAVAAVPTEFADEISLVGSVDRIRDRLQAWEESPVTMLNVAARTPEEMKQFAEIIKS